MLGVIQAADLQLCLNIVRVFDGVKVTFLNGMPYFLRMEGEIKVILWRRKASQLWALPGKKPAGAEPPKLLSPRGPRGPSVGARQAAALTVISHHTSDGLTLCQSLQSLAVFWWNHIPGGQAQQGSAEMRWIHSQLGNYRMSHMWGISRTFFFFFFHRLAGPTTYTPERLVREIINTVSQTATRGHSRLMHWYVLLLNNFKLKQSMLLHKDKWERLKKPPVALQWMKSVGYFSTLPLKILHSPACCRFGAKILC